MLDCQASAELARELHADPESRLSQIPRDIVGMLMPYFDTMTWTDGEYEYQCWGNAYSREALTTIKTYQIVAGKCHGVVKNWHKNGDLLEYSVWENEQRLYWLLIRNGSVYVRYHGSSRLYPAPDDIYQEHAHAMSTPARCVFEPSKRFIH